MRIPPGTLHGFAVLTETARVLNLYVPAALDLQVAMLSTPATSPTLPPAGAQVPATAEQTNAFQARIRELTTQAWSTQPDLLGHLRGHSGPR